MGELTAGRPHMRTGWLIVLFVVFVEVALLMAFVGLRISQQDLISADDVSLAFVDVQRGFALLESEALRTGRLDAPSVTEERAKLERQVRIGSARLNDPDTPPVLRADIEQVRSVLQQYDEAAAQRPDDAMTGADLARAGQAAAKAGTDRSEQVIRAALLQEAGAAGRGATLVAAVAGLLVAGGAALSLWLIRRYERLYGDALALARAHAAELEAANEQLEGVDRTRKRFISVLSHELRSPIAVVSAISETLLVHGDRVELSQREDLLRSISRQARRQQRMIDDLLSVVRFGQAPNVEVQTVDVGELLAQLVHDIGESGRAQVPELQVEGPISALADPAHLEQIIDNLVTNASKYGGEHCWITVSRGGDEVVITVEDDGDGVPEAFVPDLFRAYTRAEGAVDGDTEEQRGLGLGLSICRALAEASGGSLAYTQRSGGGASFTLRLQAAPS